MIAHDESVDERGAVGFHRQRAPREEHDLGEEVERYDLQHVAAQLLHDEHGRERYPVREPPGGRRDGRVASGPFGGHRRRRRQRLRLDVILHHQIDGRVHGIREPQQVADQHDHPAGSDGERQCRQHAADEQFHVANPGPDLEPHEWRHPRSGSVPQRRVDRVVDVRDGHAVSLSSLDPFGYPIVVIKHTMTVLLLLYCYVGDVCVYLPP